MKDISVTLDRMTGRTYDLRATASSLLGLTGATRLDWDEGSGEAWARLFRSDQPIIYLHRSMPFAVVLEAYAEAIAASSRTLSVISVSTFAGRAMSASMESLQRAFPKDQFTDEFDPRSFSMEELWWETV